MTTLKPYSVYKDSGVPWLGYIPDHWEARRLSSLLTRNDSGAWGSGDSQDGVKILRSTEQTANGGWRIENPAVRDLSPAEIAKTILKAGDLVVTTSSGSQKHIGKTSIVTETMEAEGYGFSNFMQRLRTSDQILPRLVWYVINNQLGREQLVYWSTTTTGLANLNGRILGSIALPVPPLDEQRAIADFLDGMDARITRFIAARRKMIALLEEKKQAVINQSVTRGLDPSVPMKDSGVDWLGEIPAHWDIRRLKSLAYMRAGEGITSSEIEEAGPIPVYGGNGLRGYTESWTHEGQFALIGRQGALCGNVHLVQGKFWASEHAIVARPTQDQDMAWFASVLHTMNLGQYSIAAAQPGIGIEAIKDLFVPFPPKDEQSAISDYIKAEAELTDSLVARHKREIELMQEYRMRLISDVVTGKLDVRGVELAPVEEIIGEEIEAMMEDPVTTTLEHPQCL